MIFVNLDSLVRIKDIYIFSTSIFCHFNNFYFLIGKMFRSSEVSKLAEFFLLFYKDKPGDWLLSHYFTVKYCKLDYTHVSCILDCPSIFSFCSILYFIWFQLNFKIELIVRFNEIFHYCFLEYLTMQLIV